MVLQFNSQSPRSVFPGVKAKMRISDLKDLLPFLPLCARGEKRNMQCLEKKTQARGLELLRSQPVMGRQKPGRARLGSPVLASDSASWKVVKCHLATRSPDCRASVLSLRPVSAGVGYQAWMELVLGASSLGGLSLFTSRLPAAAQDAALPARNVDQELRMHRDSSSPNELLQERKQISEFSQKQRKKEWHIIWRRLQSTYSAGQYCS